jgi:hypothetical protein
MPRNSLKAFVDLTLDDTSLIIREVTLHEQNGRRWIGMPGKPVIDAKTGVAERFGDTGKIRYVNVLHFGSREASDAFQREALAAIDRLNNAALKAGTNVAGR